jgi:hypothetical protein
MNNKARAAADEIDASLARVLPAPEYLKAPGISELATIISRHFSPTETTQPPYMHEDQLPVNMPKEDYDKWYAQSWIPEGVGCRVGPVYPLVLPAEAGEVERLRDERDQFFRELGETQEKLISVLALIGVVTSDDPGNAIIKMRQLQSKTRTNTISECVEKLNALSTLPFDAVPYIRRDDAVAALESLAESKQESC